MSLQKLRYLSLLIVAAAISSVISHDFSIIQGGVYFLLVLPLWLGFDLERLRESRFWKVFIWVSFLLLIGGIVIRIPLQTGVFLLILFCLIYEFYGEKRPDAPLRLISLLSFLVVIFQARIYAGLNLFVSVAVYLLALIVCLLGFNKLNHGIQPKKIHREFLRGLMPTIMVFSFGLLIFWIIPRPARSVMRHFPGAEGNRISGFSDVVRLDSIASIKQSRKAVMDVKPLQGRIHSQYLKGRVLNHFDGLMWRTTERETRYLSRDRSHRIRRADDSLERYRYQIDMQPLVGNPLFFFETVIAIESDFWPLESNTWVDYIRFVHDRPMAVSYVCSSVDVPLSYRWNRRLDEFLQLPENDGYLLREADKILGDQEMSPFRMAEMFRRHFQNEYEYSLDINNYGEGDPIRFFLSQKSGHCELFASAAALMLRTKGVPTRLVTGFVLPDLHPTGEFYHVTEADAHAWLEYYDDGVWTTLDPTPPATFTEPTYLETLLSSMNYFWRKYVVAWDAETRKETIEAIVDTAISIWQGIKALSIFLLWLIVMVVLGAIVFWWWVKARGRNQFEGVLADLERVMAVSSSSRAVGEPWPDFIARTPLPGDIRGKITSFIREYQYLRFSRTSDREGAPPRELYRQGRALVREIKSNTSRPQTSGSK